MKLYTKPRRCSTGIHIALHRVGIPFKAEVIFDGARAPDDLVVAHPSATVPVLIDGNFVLTQAVAILSYVDARYPTHGLFGTHADVGQRAEVMRWLCMLNTELHYAFAPLFTPQAYIQDASHHDALRRAAVERVEAELAVVDARLGEEYWLAGSRSAADDYAFVLCTWAPLFGIELSHLRHLQAFVQRMHADPAVRHVFRVEGLSPHEHGAA